MNGKLAWLIGGALVASALMLGGCVADAADDEQVDESQAAVDEAPPSGHPDLVGVVDPDQGVILEVPSGATPSGDPFEDSSDDGCEPEPNPWKPGGTNPQQNGGSNPPGPQQGQQGTKH